MNYNNFEKALKTKLVLIVVHGNNQFIIFRYHFSCSGVGICKTTSSYSVCHCTESHDLAYLCHLCF